MPPVRKQERPIYYCDLCHGIAPVLVESPRDFHFAQAFVVAVALAVLLAAF